MSIRFATESGTVYTLDENDILYRHGVKPLRSVIDGSDMDEPTGERIFYERDPAVGESFEYYHPTLFGCISTPVVSIEVIKDDAYYDALAECERVWQTN